MMKKFVEIFLIIYFVNMSLTVTTITADKPDECKNNEISEYKKLKDFLFCEYDSWSLSAIDDKNGTDVSIGIAPRIASFDEETGNLNIFGWMFVSWHDPHLIWNPDSFNHIRHLRLNSYALWRPEIAVLSGGNEDTNDYGLPYTKCYLTRYGLVMCVPNVHHTIRCQTDFSKWPYDRQNCTLIISTWLRSSQQIRFVEQGSQAIVMDFFESNGEWTLIASRILYDQKESTFGNRNTSATRVSIDFILDRVHNQLRARFISPAIIMMVMTLTTLWLDPKSIERISLACLNPLIHLLSIQILHWVLPHNGTTVPGILLFYANSLVLATIALFLTFILGNIQEIKIEPPTWMSSLTATILKSKIGQILLLSMLDPKVAAEVEPNADDSGDLVGSKTKTTVWGYVVIMCGWISFITFFFTYVIMYGIFIPNSSMRPPIKGLGFFDILKQTYGH